MPRARTPRNAAGRRLPRHAGRGSPAPHRTRAAQVEQNASQRPAAAPPGPAEPGRPPGGRPGAPAGAALARHPPEPGCTDASAVAHGGPSRCSGGSPWWRSGRSSAPWSSIAPAGPPDRPSTAPARRSRSASWPPGRPGRSWRSAAVAATERSGACSGTRSASTPSRSPARAPWPRSASGRSRRPPPRDPPSPAPRSCRTGGTWSAPGTGERSTPSPTPSRTWSPTPSWGGPSPPAG